MPALDFNQHALSFRAVGSGIPIAALHGSASTAKQWAPLSAHLGDDFRIIAPDMPGYGGSAAWTAEHSGSDEFGGVTGAAERISALLGSCGYPVHIVGHSAGGNVALAVAMSRPDLVASLTLIEPVAFHLLASSGPADLKLYRQIECLAGVMGASLADGYPQSGMARFVDFWNGDGAWEQMPVDRRAKLAAQAGQVIGDFAAAFAQDWPVARLRTMEMPVHLVMGLRSPAASLRITEIIAETIDHASLSMIPDAGHMMPLTHPAEINLIVERHVRRSADFYGRTTDGPTDTLSPVAA